MSSEQKSHNWVAVNCLGLSRLVMDLDNITVNRDLSRLFALCLSQRFSPAGFAFPTYNFGCALMGDIFLDQDLVQNCVS